MFHLFRRRPPPTAQQRLVQQLQERAHRIYSRQDNMGFSGNVSDEYREYAGEAYYTLMRLVADHPQQEGEDSRRYAARLRPEFERVHARLYASTTDEDGAGLGSVTDALGLLDRL